VLPVPVALLAFVHLAVSLHRTLRTTRFLIGGVLFLSLSSIQATTSPVTIVDLMVLYTPAAEQASGGHTQIEAEIQAGVAWANIVLANSRADVRIRLIHSASMAYEESGQMAMDLTRLRDRDDGFLDDAHDLRNVYAADLVCLVTATGNNYAFYGLQGPSAANAFSVIRREFVDNNFWFPVVLSFNFGCQLERPLADSVGAFPFSYGYTFILLDNTYSTAEAMTGVRLPLFSNPDLNLLGVAPGAPEGDPNAANNVKTINLTAPTVAGFRGTAPTTLAPTISRFYFAEAPDTNFIEVLSNTNLTFVVGANDADGFIQRVTFWDYDYDQKLSLVGEAINTPFKLALTNLASGTRRFIAEAVDNSGASATAMVLLHIVPMNDAFTNAIVLTGAMATVTGDNTAATIEPEEVDWAGASVWYTWTAPANGRLALSVPETTGYSFLGVFIGDSVSTLTNLYHNLDPWGGRIPSIDFEVTAGTQYYFGLYGSHTWTGGPSRFTLRLQFWEQLEVRLLQPAPHERFPAGTPITLLAEADPISPATISRIEFLSGTTVIGAFTNQPFTFSWMPQGPGHYTLAARAFDSLGSNRLSAPIQIIISPANDDLTNALPLIGSTFSVASTTRGATLEPEEPVHTAITQSNSAWFVWTAGESGRARIIVTGQEVPVSISVYSGDTYSNLIQIASNSGFWIIPVVEFDVQAGSRYRIVVAGHTLEGNFILNGQTTPPPPNDDFLSAATLDGASLVVTGLTTAATAEIGELDHANVSPSHSVWYSWMAPRSGNVEVSIAGVSFTPLIVAYAGDSLGELTRLGAATNGVIAFAALEGMVYHFVIDGMNGGTGAFTLGLVMAPPNDHFTNRTALTGFSLVVTGANVAATLETGEPMHAGVPSGKSLWWSWQAPADGCVQVDLRGSIRTAAAIYTDSDLANLTLITSNSNADYPVFDFHATAGNAYHIAIAGADSGSGAATGPIVLALTEIPTPINDNFTNRLAISGTNIFLLLTNNCATRETNEPSIFWSGHSVWHTWTAPRGGFVRVRSYSPWVNSTLGVYQGTALNNLSAIGDAINEMWYGRFGRAVSFQTTAGATYVIGTDSEPGVTVVWLEFTVPPNNDWFGARIPLAGTNVTLRGSNRGARAEFREPMHARRYAERSVWWSWTAPADGVLQITALSGEFQPRWAAYTGSDFTNLIAVGFSDPYGPFDVLPATSTCLVRQGEVYQIAVDTGRSFYTIFDGVFDLTLSFHRYAANDDFTNAIRLAGSDLHAAGSTGGATREPNEPGLGSTSLFGSLWWRWIAPESGTVNVDASASSAGMLIGIYTGDSLSTLTPVTNGQSRAVFNATAGTEYYFAIEQVSGQNPESVDLSIYYSRLSLLSPADGAVFYGPTTNVVLIAQTSGSVDEFSQIDFFHSVWRLASVTNQPLTFTWNGLSYGEYLVWVRGTNQSGRAHESLPARIFIRPANDDFENRIVLSGTEIRASSSMCMATVQPEEPFMNAATVWWSWTAPTTRRFWVRASNAYSVPQVYVFVGETLTNLIPTSFGSSEASFSAVAGTTYQIAAITPPMCSDISLYLYSRPANDDFSNRLELSGTSVTVTGSNALASAEPGEPAHAGGPPRRSVWWTWTAPQSGRLTLGLSATPYFNPWAAVYRGESLTNLTPVATVVGGFYGEEGTTNFPVLADVSYQIAADGYHGEDSRVFLRLDFTPAPPPPSNDYFANRLALIGTSITTTGSTLSASLEPGEPQHGVQPGGASVWFTWTAPYSGTAFVTVASSGFTPILAAYTGCTASNLTLVSSSTNGSLIFSAWAGTVYQFALDGQSALSGSYSLSLNLPLPPSNDHFTNRVLLTGLSATATGDNGLASREPDELLPTFATGRTLWWSWVAPSNGLAVLDISSIVFGGSAPDPRPRIGKIGPLISIYSGDTLAELSLVASNSVPLPFGFPAPPGSGWSVQSNFYFFASAGANYHIAFDGVNQSTGVVAFALSLLTEAPVNDTFSARTALSGGAVSITGSNWLAGSETGEPQHAAEPPHHTVWWTWTPPTRGQASIQVNAAFPMHVAVYTGDSLPALVPVSSGQETTTFQAESGTYYHVAVDTPPGVYGQFSLDLSFSPAPVNDHLANRIRLIGRNPSVLGSTLQATREPNEPLHPGSSMGASVWYEWTSPSTGRATVSRQNATVVVAVYVGSSYSNLIPVSEPSQAGYFYDANFYALAGVTYLIAVSEESGYFLGNPFQINITAPPPPPGISPGAASRLSDGTFRLPISGTNGQSFAFQASTNLIEWRTLVIDTMQTTTLVFDDPEATRYPHRFYRVLPLEALAPEPPLHVEAGSPDLPGFAVRVVGPGGQPFSLQASTNLVEWTPLTRALLRGNSFQFIDIESQTMPSRFYRALPIQ
jgi:hypothetical protein